MNFADADACGGASSEPAPVDPFLDGHVRLGFELQVAPARVLAIIIPERAFDIDGMGVVPFDQVAVVTVHRPYETRERNQQPLRQTAAKSRRFLRKPDGEVGQRAALT